MRIVVLVIALALMVAPVSAVGTVTYVSTQVLSLPGPDSIGGRKVVIEWTSDAAGTADAALYTPQAGRLVQARLVPDAGGTQPTDDYDVVINDASGADVLEGGGANRDNVTGTALTGLSYFFDGVTSMELVVTNAGNAKSGTVTLVFMP